MRRKRMNKNRKKSREVAIRTASLLALGTLGVAQLSSSSYALFTNQSQTHLDIATANVFPQTVQEYVNQANSAYTSAQQATQSANKVLASSRDTSVSSDQANAMVKTIQSDSVSANSSTQTIQQIVNQLNGYLNQVNSDIQSYQSEIDELTKQLSVDPGSVTAEEITKLRRKIDSAQEVRDYIQTGLSQVQSLSTQTTSQVNAIQQIVSEGQQVVTVKLQKEKQDAEDKAKQEADDKAKKDQQSKTDPKLSVDPQAGGDQTPVTGVDSSTKPVDTNTNTQPSTGNGSDQNTTNQAATPQTATTQTISTNTNSTTSPASSSASLQKQTINAQTSGDSN